MLANSSNSLTVIVLSLCLNLGSNARKKKNIYVNCSLTQVYNLHICICYRVSLCKVMNYVKNDKNSTNFQNVISCVKEIFRSYETFIIILRLILHRIGYLMAIPHSHISSFLRCLKLRFFERILEND